MARFVMNLIALFLFFVGCACLLTANWMSPGLLDDDVPKEVGRG